MSLESTAYHEAGHAVSCVRLGMDVVSVALAGHDLPEDAFDGETNGKVRFFAGDPDDPEDERRAAVVALAGLEAARRFKALHRPWAPEADDHGWWVQAVQDELQEHDQLASHVLGLSKWDDRWWSAVRPATVALVGLWWPDVERLARTLHRRGRMTGEEVAELLGPPDGRVETIQRLTLRQMRMGMAA